MRSLRARLFATTGLILVLTALIAWVASRELTRTELSLRGGPELEDPESRSVRTAVHRLAESHRAHGGWADAEAVLAPLVAELGRPVAYRLTAADGTVAAASVELDRADPTLPPGPIEISIVGSDGPLGTLELLPLPASGAESSDGEDPSATGPSAAASEIRDTRERLVLLETPSAPPGADGLRRWSVALAAIIALAALLLLGGVLFRLTRPLAELTEAARRLGDGRLGARAPVTGEDEVGALGRAFNTMAERIEENERQRKELINDVAHELRTPLTNLRARLESMLDGVAPLDAAQLEALLGDTLALGDLIDDLQVLALADAGRLELAREPIDLAREVDAVIDGMIAARARSDGERERRRVERAVPQGLTVLADRRRLRQIVSNLLTNALRYTPEDGVIEVGARRIGARIELSVRDSGPGIPAAALERIFDRFYRLEPSRDRDFGGSGLGLAIVRQLALAHGGEVRVESVLGEGSVFRVELPAPPVEASA